MRKHYLQTAGAAALATAFAIAPAYAQDTGGVDNLPPADDGAIIVTARKQAEDLQRTPVAVTALNGDLVERLAVQELDQIENFTPNVDLQNITFSSNSLGAAIRGLGFNDLEKTFDPTVGVTIDGVFLAYSTGALVDLDDVEQVEVLRGPQGTLYGRNTIGGTINITRSRPTGEFGLTAKGSYASYNNIELGAIFNAPLAEDVLALKLSYNMRKGDSFTRNVLTGERDGGPDTHTFGGALLFTPSSSFEALLSLDYQDDNTEYPPILNLTQPGELFCDILGALEPSACRSGSFDRSREEGFVPSFGAFPFTTPSETFAATLNMELDLGSGTITSITGYRDMSETLEEENTGTLLVDLGGGPVPVVAAFRPQESSQFSQELRFNSDFAGPFNFVAGVYYLEASYDIFPETNPLGTGDGQIFIFGGPVQVFEAGQDTTALAVFGEGTYNLTPDLRLSVGARLSYEKKDFYLDRIDPATGGLLLSVNPSESWTEPNWRVLLDNQFSPQVFGYASYSRGTRSGGFNGRAVSASSVGPYQPETVDSFEIGFRTESSDGRFKFNPTAFYALYDDKQEELLVGLPNGATETTVFNAANVKIWGVEIETSARPTDALTLRGALGYLDYSYSDFFALDTRPLSPTTGTIIDVSDSARLRNAPKFTLALGGDYRFPVAALSEVVLTANYKFADEFQSGASIFEPVPDPRGIVPNRSKLDLALRFNGDRTDTGLPFDTSLTVFGRDVFADPGRNGRPFNALPNFFFTTLEPGRVFGVELKVDY